MTLPLIHFAFLILAVSSAIFFKGIPKYVLGCVVIPLAYSWFSYSNIDQEIEFVFRSYVAGAGAFWAAAIFVKRKWFLAVFIVVVVLLVYPEWTYQAFYVKPTKMLLDVVDPVVDTVREDGIRVIKRKYRPDEVYDVLVE